MRIFSNSLILADSNRCMRHSLARLSLTKTAACEGVEMFRLERQSMRRKTEPTGLRFMGNGHNVRSLGPEVVSCIASPLGEVLEGPVVGG